MYIGRPSIWANPFIIGRDGTRADVVEKHREWFEQQPEMQRLARKRLKGKNLECFCAPLACHGTILLFYANQEIT